MQELINYVGRLLNIKKIHISLDNDHYLKWIKYVVLSICFVTWTLQIPLDDVSPWTSFGVLISFQSLSHLLTFGGAILFLIVIFHCLLIVSFVDIYVL